MKLMTDWCECTNWEADTVPDHQSDWIGDDCECGGVRHCLHKHCLLCGGVSERAARSDFTLEDMKGCDNAL